MKRPVLQANPILAGDEGETKPPVDSSCIDGSSAKSGHDRAGL